MKVIFIKDLKGQGKIGEIKEVKDGYAKNFLIKNNYAVLLTERSLEKLSNDIKNKKQQEEGNVREAEKIKQELEDLVLQFKNKVGKNEKVFGSISTKQICDELEKKGYKISKKNLLLENSISILGAHIVRVELYKGVVANLKIHLIKEDNE